LYRVKWGSIWKMTKYNTPVFKYYLIPKFQGYKYRFQIPVTVRYLKCLNTWVFKYLTTLQLTNYQPVIKKREYSHLWIPKMKKVLSDKQTLRASCSMKAEPKIFAPLQTVSEGAGRPKFNHLQMITIFTYRSSLVKIDARNFELSW